MMLWLTLQEQVDHIVPQAAITALDKHMYLIKWPMKQCVFEETSHPCMLLNTFGIVLNMTKLAKALLLKIRTRFGFYPLSGRVLSIKLTPTTNPTSTIFKA